MSLAFSEDHSELRLVKHHPILTRVNCLGVRSFLKTYPIEEAEAKVCTNQDDQEPPSHVA